MAFIGVEDTNKVMVSVISSTSSGLTPRAAWPSRA